MLAGEPGRAAARLRGDLEKLASVGDRGMLATTAGMLAGAVYALGQRQEAERLCRFSRDNAEADDTVTQVMWRRVQAKALADTGRYEDGERAASEAVTLIRSTDLLNDHADTMLDLAHVLRRVNPVEARRAGREAMGLYERKGNVVGVARATAMVAG
jgi:hypothetical protein